MRNRTTTGNKIEATKKRFEAIMSIETTDDWNGDNIFQGLQIMAKYVKGTLINGAEDGQIFAVSVSELVSAGITEGDVLKLRKLNWEILNGQLVTFA